MQIAYINGKTINAEEALFEYGKDKEYVCPCCREKVILKAGEVNNPYFSHLQDTDCYDDVSNDMSEWHRWCQSLFPKEYREIIITRKLKDLFPNEDWEDEEETHIADICYKDYVIEFQHSPMSADVFNERTNFYLVAGYKLIWIFDWTEKYERVDVIGETEDSCKLAIKNPPKTCMYYFPQEYKDNLMICIARDCEDPDNENLSYLERIVWARPNKNNINLADYSRLVTKDLDAIETLVKYILSK